jgi:hypothetical protein
MIFVPVANRPPYLPMSSRTPAAIANAPMTWLGIANRVNDASPVRISQIANRSIPIDTTPIVIGGPPFSLVFEAPNAYSVAEPNTTQKFLRPEAGRSSSRRFLLIFLFQAFMLG